MEEEIRSLQAFPLNDSAVLIGADSPRAMKPPAFMLNVMT